MHGLGGRATRATTPNRLVSNRLAWRGLRASQRKCLLPWLLEGGWGGWSIDGLELVPGLCSCSC